METEKYFAIMASHRKNNNTDKELKKYIKELEQKGKVVEKVDLLDFNINICKSCYYCSKSFKECIIKDDMEFFYDKFQEYDNFIFATPVYFNGVSSLGKIMIDRCQMIFSANTYFERKFKESKKSGKAILISTAGAPHYKDQFTGVESTMKLIFKGLNTKLLQHIKVSDTDENFVI